MATLSDFVRQFEQFKKLAHQSSAADFVREIERLHDLARSLGGRPAADLTREIERMHEIAQSLSGRRPAVKFPDPVPHVEIDWDSIPGRTPALERLIELIERLLEQQAPAPATTAAETAAPSAELPIEPPAGDVWAAETLKGWLERTRPVSQRAAVAGAREHFNGRVTRNDVEKLYKELGFPKGKPGPRKK
jgi:hypothetical protein